jgi:hypothetical protein
LLRWAAWCRYIWFYLVLPMIGDSADWFCLGAIADIHIRKKKLGYVDYITLHKRVTWETSPCLVIDTEFCSFR